MHLAPALVEAFHRDGVVKIEGAFSPYWLATIEKGIDRELASPGPGFVEQQDPAQPGRFVTDYCPAQRVPELQSFITQSPAAEIVAQILRSKTAHFLMDVLWIKEPGTAKRTAWHQDQPYFCVDGAQMCSIWLPVDPVPKDVSLRFIKGSHAWNRWFRPQLTKRGQELYTFDDPNQRWETIPDFDTETGKHEVLSFEIAPGDCLVFHALTVHDAPGNPQKTARRRVLTTVWFGDDATFGVRPSPPRPHFTGHGLQAGQPMRSPLFPQLWPRDSDGGKSRFAPNGDLRFSI